VKPARAPRGDDGAACRHGLTGRSQGLRLYAHPAPKARRDPQSGDCTCRSELRARSFTIDGEAAVCGPDGVAAFETLHRRRPAADAILFDLLELDGHDLRRLPLGERKTKLPRAGGASCRSGWPRRTVRTVTGLDQGQEPE
jgi:hypothetical protein